MQTSEDRVLSGGPRPLVSHAETTREGRQVLHKLAFRSFQATGTLKPPLPSRSSSEEGPTDSLEPKLEPRQAGFSSSRLLVRARLEATASDAAGLLAAEELTPSSHLDLCFTFHDDVHAGAQEPLAPSSRTTARTGINGREVKARTTLDLQLFPI